MGFAAMACKAESRRGVSPVIATAILTSIMLTIVAVALYYSTSLIDLNRQTMEYEYAKEQLTYAATALEQVAFGSGGSRYVRFSLTSTGISFLQSSQAVTVYANGVMVYQGTPLVLQVCGGPLVTTVPRLLYPETGDMSTELSRLVVSSGQPIVLVYENFTGRACAFLTARFRAFFSSQVNVTVGGTPKKYNYFVLHIVELVPGNLGGSGTIPVIFRSVNMTVSEYVFEGTNSITLVVSKGSASQTASLNGPPADGSVLIVKVAKVIVSTS
jgi:flagellin-like protein